MMRSTEIELRVFETVGAASEEHVGARRDQRMPPRSRPTRQIPAQSYPLSLVGDRWEARSAYTLMQDVASRIRTRVQMATGGQRAYNVSRTP